MADLDPDHMNLLALARRAIEAESGSIWRTNVEEAADTHAAACNALWDELRRQIDLQDGKVPVLENPALKQRSIALRMKRQIINTCIVAVEGALEDLTYDESC